MIDLTDLQENILRHAVRNPEMTNKEIANKLGCSEDWVGEVRRKYEHKVDKSKIGTTGMEANADLGQRDDAITLHGTTDAIPDTSGGETGSDRTAEILLATGAWWLPVIGTMQGADLAAATWLLLAGGWVAVPALVGLDAKRRGSLGGGLVYVGMSVVLPMIGGLVYLYRRG